MKLSNKATLAVASLTVLGAFAPSVASATVPTPINSNTSGFDEVNDLVLSGGSDTTYGVQVSLSSLYNGSLGCERQIANGGPAQDVCKLGQTPAAGPFGNWDHDIMTQVYPTGSSAGVGCLLPALPSTVGPCNQPLDTARSSRAISTAEAATLSQFGFARDALIPITMSGRSIPGIATADLTRIYNCQNPAGAPGNYIWSDLGDTGPNAGDPVIPVGMNSGSGTANAYASFIGLTNAAGINAKTCVHKLGSGTAPFENDLKQIKNDTAVPAGLTGPDATTPMATLYAAGKTLWWMSYAAQKALPDQAQTAAAVPVNGIAASTATVNNGSFPFTRYVYQVARKSDITPTVSSGSAAAQLATGATLGKGGAVREYLTWMCKFNASHALNGDDGQNLGGQIDAAIVSAGFNTVPSNQRQWGKCRLS
jgi:hypothetical protein